MGYFPHEKDNSLIIYSHSCHSRCIQCYFFLWNTKGGCLKNLPTALFHTITLHSDCQEMAIKNTNNLFLHSHLQSQAYEFQFGLEYAWTMCIFSVSMTYSITCPIIVPFGESV